MLSQLQQRHALPDGREQNKEMEIATMERHRGTDGVHGIHNFARARVAESRMRY